MRGGATIAGWNKNIYTIGRTWGYGFFLRGGEGIFLCLWLGMKQGLVRRVRQAEGVGAMERLELDIDRHKCLCPFHDLYQAPMGIGPQCKKCPLQSIVGANTKMPCICPMITIGKGVLGRSDGSISS